MPKHSAAQCGGPNGGPVPAAPTVAQCRRPPQRRPTAAQCRLANGDGCLALLQNACDRVIEQSLGIVRCLVVDSQHKVRPVSVSGVPSLHGSTASPHALHLQPIASRRCGRLASASHRRLSSCGWAWSAPYFTLQRMGFRRMPTRHSRPLRVSEAPSNGQAWSLAGSALRWGTAHVCIRT